MDEPHVVFVTLGTAGDAIPFIGLASALKARGRGTILLSNENHGALARDAGIDFLSVCEPERPQVGCDPRLFFAEQLLPAYYRIEKEIRRLTTSGRSVFVVSRFGNWGAAFACERHGLPFVNVLLQPDAIWEKGEPAHPADLVLANRFRRDIGLSPIQGEGVLEPALAKISLFPEWFGHPQSLSPAAGRCFGFPFVSQRSKIPAEVGSFIAKHGLPTVFTLGTGVQDVAAFLKVARTFNQDTGRPVLFLSRSAREVGGETETFRIHEHVDHAWLLPKASAVVHNGGIGVTAQAMRAGVPQVVIPLVWDQPDNAARIEALGAGVIVRPDALTTEKIKQACEAAFKIDSNKLRQIAESVRSVDAIDSAAGHLDTFLNHYLCED